MRGPGEAGIGSVTIQLTGTDATGAPVNLNVVTGADGSFRFEDLLAGSYTLSETQPAAYADGGEALGTIGGAPAGTLSSNDEISAIALGGGEDGIDYLFGELAQAIAGRVYFDADRDGVDDAEAGIGDVTVSLRDSAGTVIATTLTLADGSYSFTGLAAGSYTVEETQPVGYGSSTPNSVALVLAADGATARADFGETRSTLAGQVYMDLNDNRAVDVGETPIAGVEVRLTGADANGVAVNLSVTTAPDGTFLFENLLSGSYTVIETQPSAYVDGGETAGSSGGSTAVNDEIGPIALAVGIDATGYLFGERGQSLNGHVYADRDRNGDLAGSDQTLDGVTITLEDGTGTTIATTQTGPNGAYSFVNLVGGTYTVVETQPVGYGAGIENGSNSVTLQVTASALPDAVDFGETVGALSGFVYLDAGADGVRGPGEAGIGGVNIQLTGTDATGAPVSVNVVTGADGSFLFEDVLSGTYTLSETQPVDYADGSETLGEAGGDDSVNDIFSSIVLAAGQVAGGYLYAEIAPIASISGHVWCDANSNRRIDGGEERRQGWTVELWRNGSLEVSTVSDADGAYQFLDQPAGGGYTIRFRNPASGLPAGGAVTNETGAAAQDGVVSPANPGGATRASGEIADLTLRPGINLAEQSLPLDPAGVVYDAVSRAPVAGAVVEIRGPAGFAPALHLLGGAAAASQATGPDGFYQYWLTADAPAGEYRLVVTPPSSYLTDPSTMIPACAAPLDVGPGELPLVIQTNATAPARGAPASCTPGGETTAYWLAFILTPGVSAHVVHNHIPVDPVLDGAIVMAKTTSKTMITRGDLVPYTISARNTTTSYLRPIEIVDRIPGGFAYRVGSATLNGVPVEPQQRGRDLVWTALEMAPGSEITIKLVLVAGSSVREGDHTNQAFAVQTTSGRTVSNTAEATVRFVPDPNFDCTDIIGKVFDDRNGDGDQGADEPGLPGVRLATVNGLLVTTDADGRYHIACAAVPNEDRGSNFVLKLDQRTLPRGYRLTTDNPNVSRLSRGKVAKVNFGAAIFRTIRIDLDELAFENGEVGQELTATLEELVSQLDERPSVARVSYHMTDGVSEDVAQARLDSAVAVFERIWAARKGRCPLIVETTFGVTSNGGGK